MSIDFSEFAASIHNRVAESFQYHFDWGRDKCVYEMLGNIPVECGPSKPLAKRLLLDGHFLNPGYYYRLQLLRAAVGSNQGDELGFVWRHNSAYCSRILSTLGVQRVTKFFPHRNANLRHEAHRIARKLRFADDLLETRFPNDVPATFLYDDILKRQRAATVDVSDPLVERYVWEFLSSIKAAEDLLDGYNPDLIAMSHVVSTQCAPLSWLGARRSIPVVTLFGNYGVPRFWRMNRPEDICFGMDRPENQDLDTLSTSQADALGEIGRSYLALRLNGLTNDLGGRMAFAGDADIGFRKKSGDDRPTIAVYASNWFDFPHALGMSRFRDFLDWTEATLQVALNTPSVRWLFRAHPCDKWYGGITLKDIMPEQLPEHVMLVPDQCPGSLVMDMVDSVVTYHGTAAIEYASRGKPVLIPDRGWYHDCGFALYPDSREHYLSLLGSDWFNSVDVYSARRRAEIFAGWYFCIPEWQANLTLLDDSDRTQQKEYLMKYLEESGSCVRHEISLIREWMASHECGYHTFKMRQAKGYSLSNALS